MSNSTSPGPMMLLRRALPYCPGGGATNAAVLNHSLMLGFGTLTGDPVTSALSVPFTPLFTLAYEPKRRGVNGRPEAIVQSPLHCQPPKMSCVFPSTASHRLPLPKGSSHK